MKKAILMALMSCAACTVMARNTLTVIDQDYELARRTALQQHKLLLVDFYTTWCVPCKMLDKAIFQNDSMAMKLDKEFVVLKYDAEKDKEHNLSLKHHIGSYPTTVVLTPGGRLVHKMFGTGDNGALVANYMGLLEESVQRNKQGKYIDGYSAAIDTGIYPVFYKNYVRRIANIKPGDLSNYWAENKDLESEASFVILAYFGQAPKPVADFFLQHKPAYEKRFGTKDVQFVLQAMASEKFSSAVSAKDQGAYEAAVAFAQQQLPAEEAQQFEDIFRIQMFIATANWKAAASVIEERIRLKTIDAQGVNYFCWSVYEQCDSKEMVTKAVYWMAQVVASEPSFALLDTYARLLAKNGDKEGAIREMKRAIAKGKDSGDDTADSEAALKAF